MWIVRALGLVQPQDHAQLLETLTRLGDLEADEWRERLFGDAGHMHGVKEAVVRFVNGGLHLFNLSRELQHAAAPDGARDGARDGVVENLVLAAAREVDEAIGSLLDLLREGPKQLAKQKVGRGPLHKACKFLSDVRGTIDRRYAERQQRLLIKRDQEAAAEERLAGSASVLTRPPPCRTPARTLPHPSSLAHSVDCLPPPAPLSRAQVKTKMLIGARRAHLVSELHRLLGRDALLRPQSALALGRRLSDNTGIVLGALQRTLTTDVPGSEPRSEEACRQLLFFANSLHNRRLAPPPPVTQMKSFTTLTPHYAEDITYSIAMLQVRSDDRLVSDCGLLCPMASGRLRLRLPTISDRSGRPAWRGQHVAAHAAQGAPPQRVAQLARPAAAPRLSSGPARGCGGRGAPKGTRGCASEERRARLGGHRLGRCCGRCGCGRCGLERFLVHPRGA